MNEIVSTYDLRLALGEQGEDGGTRVSTNDRDGVLGRVGSVTNNGSDEGGSSDNVEVGDTEQSSMSAFLWLSHRARSQDLPLGVVDTSLLQGLSEDGDGRVNRVGDDEDEGLGTSVGNSLSEGGTDTSVDFLKCQFQVRWIRMLR